MASKYGFYFDDFTTATSVKTAAALHPDAAGECAECTEANMFGSGISAAADTMHTARLVRSTNGTNGTATSQTPEKFDGNDQASAITCRVEFSVEPATLATIYPVLYGFNQRSGMRWAVPKGEGLWCRNSDTNLRLLLQVISSAAGKVDGGMIFFS
jgi:hypothetical protein